MMMKDPREKLREYEDAGLLRRLRSIDCLPGGMARMEDGREVVNLASNDYLGLAHHPSLMEAMQKGVVDYGVGSTASRLVTGTRAVHARLEAALAELKGTEASLSFSSGYATSVGLIPSIAAKGDVIILDKLSHASLIDGAKLSGAQLHTFLHNDVDSLRRQLSKIRAKMPDTNVLVVTESVFSMDGDRAPLREIADVKDEFSAMLLVDEAHGFGLMGRRGAGLASECGVSERVEFQMGTLSKSAGLSGGYVACSRAWADCLINQARSFIYSTAPAPCLAEAALESIRLIAGDEGEVRRARLGELAREFSMILGQSGRPMSSIFPYIVGENEDALSLADRLLERGYLAPAIRFPTVPRGTARLRMTLTANHSDEQLAGIKAALSELK